MNFQSEIEAPRINQPDVIGRDVFFNAYPFWRHLHTYDSVWATTFTYDPVAMESLPLTRLVCAKIRHLIVPKSVAVKVCANNHAKIFICWKQGRISCVFFGSWNLVSPTWLEVITKIPEREFPNAIKYFESIWHQSKTV